MAEIATAFMAMALSLAACGGGGDAPEKPDDGGTVLPSVKNLVLGDSFTIPFGDTLHLGYSGMKVGDEIRMSLRSDPAKTYVMTCVAAGDARGAAFRTPDRFIGGMCLVKIGDRTFETFVKVTDNAKVPMKTGSNVYGRVIDWDGRPLEGVAVSDGVNVTSTDADGRYWMNSRKKEGFVFISVPSGYRVAVDRSIPQFFARFKTTYASDYEMNNFILEPEDNSAHRLLVFTDCHLANRTNDVAQFEDVFKKDIEGQAASAVKEGIPVYGIALGDLSWDEWWYRNDFTPEDYYREMQDVDFPIYNIPGNHDNDPYVADDFKAEAMFRKWIGPTYYSFNLGKVHYILMDDTIFKNSGASQGVVGNVQDYHEGLTSNEAAWLKADMAMVPKDATVVLGLHIPYTGRPKPSGDMGSTFGYSMVDRTAFESVFNGRKVHIISGHTHFNYTNRISDDVIEHNIASVCATWWWTGYYTSGRSHICRDGSPGGYKIFDVSSSGGFRWRYKGAGRSEEYQFRVYDLNNCLISRDLYCPAAKNPKVSDEVFSKYVYGYDVPDKSDKLLVNVFDFDDDWKVEAEENGVPLEVTRVDAYDPLHIVQFNTRRMNTNSASVTFPTLLSSHLFKIQARTATSDVTVTVTDSFGRVYTEKVSRPRLLHDMSESADY